MPNDLSSQNLSKTSAPAASAPASASAATDPLATSFLQAQLACRRGDWASAIGQFEAAIAQCKQRLQSEARTPKPPVQTQVARQTKLEQTLPSTVSSTVPSAVSSTAISASAQADAEIYKAKGNLFKSQGQLEQAAEAYKEAIALDSTLSEARIALSETYVSEAQKRRQASDISGAVSAYLQALKQHPLLPVAYNRLRYNLMRYDIPQGDPLLVQIAEVCQHVLEQHPDMLQPRITLAYALTRLGRSAEAIACYRQMGDQLARRQLNRQKANQTVDPASTASPDQPARPSFMIIGAEKCGTTSLYQYLRKHPSVLTPIEKEIDFFDAEYEQGIDWYLAHFPSIPTVSQQPIWITGETSANYLYDDAAPARVFEHFPSLQLAVILRHPIDRTESRYNMMVRNGTEKRSFDVAVQEEIALIEAAATEDDIPWSVLNRCRHVGNSLYFYHLRRWLTLFPRKQLMVLRSEDLFAQPAETLSQLYQAFGLSHHPEQTYPKHNSGQYQPADSEIRRVLADFFKPHTQKLEALLTQSFNWDL